MRLFPATSSNLIDFGAVPAGAMTTVPGIFVSSTTGMVVGDTIEIMLDSGVFFRTKIKSILSSTQIKITDPLPFRATAGNVLVDLTQSKNVPPDNEDFLT